MAIVYVMDGGRRFTNSGYGQLARSVITAIQRHSEHQVVVLKGASSTGQEIPREFTFSELPELENPSEICDAILTISPIKRFAKPKAPLIWYTQNALGGLISEWAEYMQVADTIIVPGMFDFEHFAVHHSNVRICEQVVDYNFYKPMPKFRTDGPDIVSFGFVGSFSYRKGVDLVGEVFSKAFSDGAPVHVHLHCFSGLEGDGLNRAIAMARGLPSNISITLDNKSLNLPWMRRKINSFDAVFTLSRGEGWCMPLWESLFSGLPVVAPNSTAMGEFLPTAGVTLFDVEPVLVSEISDPLGKSLQRKYGEPGIYSFEPVIASAAEAIRHTYDNLISLKAAAASNRETLAHDFSYEKMGRKLSEIIDETLARTPLKRRGLIGSAILKKAIVESKMRAKKRKKLSAEKTSQE